MTAPAVMLRHEPRATTRRGLRLRPGFTLVELLIVVLALAILSTLTVPMLASATTPLVRPIADLLEADLRRARLESIGAGQEVVLVVGGDRMQWWLQRAGPLDPANAIPTSHRLLGSGELRPFADHALAIKVDGADMDAGDAVLARFDVEGARDSTTIEVTFVSPGGLTELAQWRIEPGKTRLK